MPSAVPTVCWEPRVGRQTLLGAVGPACSMMDLLPPSPPVSSPGTPWVLIHPRSRPEQAISWDGVSGHVLPFVQLCWVRIGSDMRAPPTLPQD